MRWAGHVASTGERRDAYKILVGIQGERGHLEDPGIGGRIILRWIFRKWDGGMDWVGLVQDRDRWWAVKAVMNLWFP
jgi:predicted double-glycine peptidase